MFSQKCAVLVFSLAAVAVIGIGCPKGNDTHSLLNVSYDPTREMYQEYNEAFQSYWKEHTGQTVTIMQSHGGSGSQARSVIDGNAADVITLACAYDIDAIAEKAHLMPADWQSRLPYNSCPYTSTIVFLVRQGNPKNIHDWDDVVKPGISIITPNPKTSGGARWNYLAAWGYALSVNNGDEDAAQEFVTKLYKNVHSMDTGARGSTIKFVENGIGDVLLAWENEALLVVNKTGVGEFEIIIPSISIIAEPPVTVIDTNANKHGNRECAQAYLEYLYTPEGQEIIANHYYRPQLKEIAEKYAAQYPHITLFSIDDVFGGWQNAQRIHFNDGGIFDQIYETGN